MKNKAKKPTAPPLKASSNLGLVPIPSPGTSIIAFLESGALGAAQQIKPTQASLLLVILQFAVWLVIAKSRLQHRTIGQFIKRLIELCPGLPSRSEIDLWVRMLLQSLFKYGYLPSGDLKFYRRDPAPLHHITFAQLKKIADDYLTLRAMQREFGNPKAKSPAQIIIELFVALRRRVEASPDAVSDEVTTEFHALQTAMRAAKETTKATTVSNRKTSGGKKENRRLLKRGKKQQKRK